MNTKNLIIALLVMLAFSSCKKEPIEEPVTTTQNVVLPADTSSHKEDTLTLPIPEEKNLASLFWKISGGDLEKPSYLFGTIHLVPKNRIQFMPTLDSILDLSDRLVLEANLKDPAIHQASNARAKLKDASVIRDLYSPQDLTELSSICGELGLDLNTLLPFKPFVISQLLSSQSLGQEYDLTGYEDQLMNLAQSKGVPLSGAEGPDYVYTYLDKLDLNRQAQDLMDWAAEYRNDPTGTYSESLDIYLRQDIEGLFYYIQTNWQSHPDYYNTLVAERNIHWLDQELIVTNESHLIAVGAGHLWGAKGLITLLQEQGYKVEPITASP